MRILFFALINNIPPFYHSSDLRNYFSQFLEEDGFVCCHFKHRPEVKKCRETLIAPKTSDIESVVSSNIKPETHDNSPTVNKRTFCCVVKVKGNTYPYFRALYHKKHWLDHNGDSIPALCSITKVNIAKNNQGKGK